MTSKTPLARYLKKYLLSGVAGALAIAPVAIAPVAAHADSMMTTTTTTSTTMTAAEPTAVNGTVEKYWVDRSGYVSAMTVKTSSGSQLVRFSPSKAKVMYETYPVGSTIDVWVTPGSRANVWEWRGTGANKPQVWMPVNTTSDFEWMEATPYITAESKETTISGELKGVVVNARGDVLGLAVDTGDKLAMIRVPAELRHVARGHIGSGRVAPLFEGAEIEASGLPEAPRLGVLTPFSHRLAANTISVDGKHAGSIGIQMLPEQMRRSLLGWNIGDDMNNEIIDTQANDMGYMVYQPVGTPITETLTTPVRSSVGGGTMTTTTTTMTETATGRVMIVAADGQMLPVVKRNDKIWVMMSDGSTREVTKRDGKYVVPSNMQGARMMMVMSDGRRMEMDTVNGQLMVLMADGSMAPVTLHTP